MPKHQLIIATRESPLALKQAHWVKAQLEAIHPQLTVKLLGMTTEADRLLTLSLTKVGGKGLFVKELEAALLDGRADIAVHSMKDMPMELPEGLCLPVICKREDPRDAFVSNDFKSLDELPPQSKIGTSSLRRQCQLQAKYPHLSIVPLRGNVNTRLKRLDDGDFSALILAVAGLKRLGIERPYQILSIDHMLPAGGQGALGIEVRIDRKEVHELIRPLNHLETQYCVLAERAMCKRLGGGCQLPIGAYAVKVNDTLLLKGLVENLRAEGMDNISQAEPLGIKVAEALIAQGAEALLK